MANLFLFMILVVLAPHAISQACNHFQGSGRSISRWQIWESWSGTARAVDVHVSSDDGSRIRVEIGTYDGSQFTGYTSKSTTKCVDTDYANLKAIAVKVTCLNWFYSCPVHHEIKFCAWFCVAQPRPQPSPQPSPVPNTGVGNRDHMTSNKNLLNLQDTSQYGALGSILLLVILKIVFACVYKCKVTDRRKRLQNPSNKSLEILAPHNIFSCCCHDLNLCMTVICCFPLRAADNFKTGLVTGFWSVFFFVSMSELIALSIESVLMVLYPDTDVTSRSAMALGVTIGIMVLLALWFADTRQKMRRRFGGSGSEVCSDFICYFFCTACAVAQDAMLLDEATGMVVHCCCQLGRPAEPVRNDPQAAAAKPMGRPADPVRCDPSAAATTTAAAVHADDLVGQPIGVDGMDTTDASPVQSPQHIPDSMGEQFMSGLVEHLADAAAELVVDAADLSLQEE